MVRNKFEDIKRLPRSSFILIVTPNKRNLELEKSISLEARKLVVRPKRTRSFAAFAAPLISFTLSANAS